MVGEAEGYKGAVHAFVATLAGAMALHNAMECSTRREWRLAVNVGIYSGLWFFELQQARRHWQRC